MCRDVKAVGAPRHSPMALLHEARLVLGETDEVLAPASNARLISRPRPHVGQQIAGTLGRCATPARDPGDMRVFPADITYLLCAPGVFTTHCHSENTALAFTAASSRWHSKKVRPHGGVTLGGDKPCMTKKNPHDGMSPRTRHDLSIDNPREEKHETSRTT